MSAPKSWRQRDRRDDKLMPTPHTFRCDFCSVDPVAWEYPVMTPVQSQSFWLACHACHGLIESDDWLALIQRTIDTSRPSNGPGDRRAPHHYDPRVLEVVYEQFKRARIGPPVRVVG